MDVATDNHLGYNEKDPVRCDDSFNAFEEILQLACAHNVDGILLGGDLFHENKPSRLTMHRTMELLRYYCLGDRPCELELLSDPSVNFPSKFGTVNYEDPNYNVAMPIFVIHGNHDDPSGDGNLSPIDILSTAGLVNYFGKTASVDDITIVPILLRKGETRLALYGLGGIRDERLHRTFLQKKVKMMRPTEDPEDWFSMLILHQNRIPHGPTNYIPETFLDDFLDLVVWGHEHESLACDPTVCTQRGFMVCQPGSSVATSLCEGESKTKHVVILKVTGTEFETTAIPLKSVRPFAVKDVALREVMPRLNPTDSATINSFLCNEVDKLIEETNQEWAQRNQDKEAPLPLIRLRVDCALPMDVVEDMPKAAYAVINPQRFGQQFNTKVANPRDILHFLRKKGGAAFMAAQKKKTLIDAPTEAIDGVESIRVETLVSQYLDCQRLDLFPQNEFGDILRTSIEKTDISLIERFVKESIGRILVSSENREDSVLNLDPEAIKVEFERIKIRREEEWNRLHPTIESVLMDKNISNVENEQNGDCEEEEVVRDPKRILPSTRGRGRGRGKAITTTALRGNRSGISSSSRLPSSAINSEMDEVENENDGDGNFVISDTEDEEFKRPSKRLTNPTKSIPQGRKALTLEVNGSIGKSPSVDTLQSRTKTPTAALWPSRKKA